jgi:hypothetical protein
LLVSTNLEMQLIHFFTKETVKEFDELEISEKRIKKKAQIDLIQTAPSQIPTKTTTSLYIHD